MRARSIAVPPALQHRNGSRYEVGEEIAHGGMGVILQGWDRLTARDVAYKRLLVRDQKSRARATALFEREYETLARLPHPNIVEVYDYGVDHLGPYYVMELLTGADLSCVAPLPCREACRILRDVASALALVHARRLIHRDISPGNIRLTSDGRAKLIDFGALMPFGKQRELVGTPAYIAPESLSNSELDQRTDIYSFGAVAYWILTGRPPVQARGLADLVDAWNDPLHAPSAYVPDVPRELDEIVLSMLSRDPLGRPSSAAYLIERLTTIADLPPEADERRVAYSYLAHPPLVGREHIRDTLTAAVNSAVEGRGGAVLIEAAAGLGRSAVAGDLAMYGQLAGVAVLRADGESGMPSFSLARKLMQGALTLYPDLEEAQARESLQSYHPERPHVKAILSPLEVAERHARVVASVQEVLLGCAKREPVLIIVDDLHMVDEQSLSLLATLAQCSAQRQLVIVATVVPGRSKEQSPAYTNFERTAAHLSLSLLDQTETTELVSYVFGNVPNSTRFARWLQDQSGGNPGTIMDLARLLLQREVIRYTLGTFSLPHDASTDLSQDDLAQANLARLADLGPRARAIAGALSMSESALSVQELGLALELSEAEVALATWELTERNVAVPTEQGFALASVTLCAALQRTLSTDEKPALHERLARALLTLQDGSPERQLLASTHLLRAGREQEAADLVFAAVKSKTVGGDVVARWAATIESAVELYRKQGRRKERCLALMGLIVRAGFYGSLAVQRRLGATCLEWMSLVCGMTLARKLRPFVGGKIALAAGLLYASLRRAFTPPEERLGTVKEMLSAFVSIASACTGAAASALESESALRYAAWLEPFSVLPTHHPAALMREFSLANADISAGDWESAARRYARIMPILSQPVAGMDEWNRAAFYRGCLNGRAQAEAAMGSAKALEFADELAKSPFFAPHAECARMTYYGYRGEQRAAELHRSRAELLALRGGTSWSAATVLTVRATYIALLNQDAIATLHAMNELERFSLIAPKLRIIKAIAEAWLEHLRGKPERALALFERVLQTAEARQLSSWRVDRTLYATVLNAAGRHARAREVCLELLGDPPNEQNRAARGALPQLALAEAGLGRLEVATERMRRFIAQIQPTNNALLLGNAHRDGARIAVLAQDKASYEHHFEEMKRHYGASQNPSLIQQIEVSAAVAQRSGLTSSGRIVHSLSAMDDFESKTVIEALERDSQPNGLRGAP